MINIVIYNEHEMDIIDEDKEITIEITDSIKNFTINECIKMLEEADD